MKKSSEKEKFMAKKMHEIKTMGVRRNTHAPVSSSNPRRQVPHEQAVAIALNSEK